MTSQLVLAQAVLHGYIYRTVRTCTEYTCGTRCSECTYSVRTEYVHPYNIRRPPLSPPRPASGDFRRRIHEATGIERPDRDLDQRPDEQHGWRIQKRVMLCRFSRSDISVGVGQGRGKTEITRHKGNQHETNRPATEISREGRKK
jgi:hypothetical protein